MGNESEHISERYYREMPDEQRFEVLEHFGENASGGTLELPGAEKKIWAVRQSDCMDARQVGG